MATANNEFEITKTEEEWRRILTPEQFQVLRKHGTERPHTSPLDKQYGRELLSVLAATCHCLLMIPSSIVALAGRVFIDRLKERSPRR